MKVEYDPETKKVVELFLRQTLERSGAAGYVVGVSGGLDSAVCLSLCVRAVGAGRVLSLMMPTAENNPADLKDATEIVASLSVRSHVVAIDEPRDSLARFAGAESPADKGNVAARVRMAVLYAYAKRENLLVVGTSNKTELLVGYFTKFGDGGSDVCPIGDLYKSQVRAMANDLQLPVKLIEKAPSAGLVPGQTDEADLGIKYEELDAILAGLEARMSDESIAKDTSLPLATIQRIRSMHMASVHKRRLTLIPKLGLRTVGGDWREI